MLIHTLKQEDFQRLLDAPTNLRDKTLLRLYFSTGARNSEIRSLRWQDIDFKGRTITITDSKKKGERFVLPIDSKTVELLQEYRKVSTSEYIFVGTRIGRAKTPKPYVSQKLINWLIKKYAVELDLPDWNLWNARIFRRAFARGWVRKGGSLTGLAEIMRHTSIATTAVYVQHLKFQDESRKEYDLIMG